MSIDQVKNYDLPDSYLFENQVNDITVKVWIPEHNCIVLGRSNNPTDSLFVENIIIDNIPVYKRPSGGETVILTPNTLVISIAIEQSNFKGGKAYFKLINSRILDTLRGFGIDNINNKGISDIAINDVKILGSALYQNKDIVFYHAVLNVSESTDLMDRFIKHPFREPDYRKNRQHNEFVTSLKKEGYDIDTSSLILELEKNLLQLQF